MLLLLAMVVAVISALFIGLTGAITESHPLTLLCVGATIWAVTLGALAVDAERSSA